MPAPETDRRRFEIPRKADFFAHTASTFFDIRQQNESEHTTVTGYAYDATTWTYQADQPYIYDATTCLYDKEKTAFDGLMETCDYMDANARDMVIRSARLAFIAHAHKYRDSGEPYTMHILDVATRVAQHRMDAVTVSAALLHDAIEDTRDLKDSPHVRITYKTIDKYINRQVADTVDGLTNVRAVLEKKEIANEQTRLGIIASLAFNTRIAIIKVYDRLSNMETLQGKKKMSKRLEKIVETEQIYIPLAGLLRLTEEAERLKYLCLLHDNRTDQDRLAFMQGARDVLAASFGEQEAVDDIQKVAGVYTKFTVRPSGIDSAYNDQTHGMHMNVDIPVEIVVGNQRAKAEILLNVARRFLYNGQDKFSVTEFINEFELLQDIEDGRADSAHFWVLRKQDGVWLHMHIYPKNVYEIESVPLTYCYRYGLSERSMSPEDAALYAMATHKQKILAERLDEILHEGINVPLYILRNLEAGRNPNQIYVTGVSKDEFDHDVRKSTPIMRGSTILDYAYVIFRSGDWQKITKVEINGVESVDIPETFSYILQSNDVVRISTDQTRVEPSWIHFFVQEQGAVRELQNKFFKALRRVDRQPDELFADVLGQGFQQAVKQLPAGSPPFRYGLLESGARPIVEKVAAEIMTIIENKKLDGTVRAIRSISSQDIQLQELFYFGVGMRLVPEDAIREVMFHADKSNRQVRSVRVEFAENLAGQTSSVSTISRELGINVLSTLSSRGVAQGAFVQMYIAPVDAHRIKELCERISHDEAVASLRFKSLDSHASIY